MKRRKPVFTMRSYGEYTPWNRASKEIPKILNFTTEIEAEIGTEFGYVLHIKNGKGESISFTIDHPPFKNKSGQVTPSFTGDQFIRTNDYLFFLGDCIWEPIEDKLGTWELITRHNGNVVAHKKFTINRKKR